MSDATLHRHAHGQPRRPAGSGGPADRPPVRSGPALARAGIDTCLRGICRYLPVGLDVAVVGVDTGGGGPDRGRIGHWERYDWPDGRRFWFLPVVALDPADQRRRVPARAAADRRAVARFRHRLPRPEIVQVHRMDTALALRRLLRIPQDYFIHTQENGLTGTHLGLVLAVRRATHRRLERSVVRRARPVVVFNESVRRPRPPVERPDDRSPPPGSTPT